ncbi:MAG: hypothetical protein ACOCZS_00915 [Verrucomicrobiota bacterium]
MTSSQTTAKQSNQATSTSESPELKAVVDFICLDSECESVIKFNIMDLEESGGRVSCPECYREYRFDKPFLDKLQRLRKLIMAVREAEDLLGDVNVAITTSTEEVKIPYRLLLTRLNTTITIDMGGRKVDFNFRIEPLNEESIR